MTDESETPGAGEGSDVEPLPPPRPGQTLEAGEDPFKLPTPRPPEVLEKADHGESESK